jgi:hypothetical protein
MTQYNKARAANSGFTSMRTLYMSLSTCILINCAYKLGDSNGNTINIWLSEGLPTAFTESAAEKPQSFQVPLFWQPCRVR